MITYSSFASVCLDEYLVFIGIVTHTEQSDSTADCIT